MVTKKQTIGFLAIVLTIVTGVITGIVLTQDNLSISIKPDSATFKSKTGTLWTTTGIEKLYLDGILLSGNISQSINGKQTDIKRSGSHWYDTYSFDGSLNTVETFPIAHQINIIGAKGKQFKYIVSSLKGVTAAHNVVSGENFGYKMRVTFDDGYTTAKVTKAGTMTVIYTVPSNDWTLNVRLFDPPVTIDITNPINNGLINNSQQTYLSSTINTTENLTLFKLKFNDLSSNWIDSYGILYYNFDNISSIGDNSTYATDLFNIRPATLNNSKTQYVTGINGQGLKTLFNQSSAVTIPTFSTSENITVMMWINPQLNFSDQIIGSKLFQKYNSTCGFRLERGTTTNILYVYNGTQRALKTYTTGQAYSINGTWRHITLTKAGDTWTVYDDGILSTSSTYPSSCLAPDAFSIATSGWAGIYDDVIIYNRSLSYSEIKQHYSGALRKINSNQYELDINLSYFGMNILPSNNFSINVSTPTENASSPAVIFDYCIVPYENFYFYQSTKLCANQFLNLPDADANGATKIISNNTYIDCQNSTMNGTNVSNARSIEIASLSNITVRNCVVTNYYEDLYAANSINVLFENNTLVDYFGWRLFATDNINLTIRGNLFNRTTTTHLPYGTTMEHSIYLSQQDDINGDNESYLIENNWIQNSNNQGIHINDANRSTMKNLVIRNNTIIGAGTGITCWSCDGAQIYNNKFMQMELDDIRFAYNDQTNASAARRARNNSFFNNTLYCDGIALGGTCIQFEGTENNKIYNNTYIPSIALIQVRTNSNAGVNYTARNISIIETHPLTIYYDATRNMYPGINVSMNFKSNKNILINDNNITFSDGLLSYPYNDIRNQTVNLTSGFSTYSKLTNINEILQVGFFNSTNRVNKNLTINGVLCPFNDTCIVSVDFDLAEVSQ